MLKQLTIAFLSFLFCTSAFASQQFVCNTSKHTAIVNLLPSGEYRYMAWNKPRSITKEPDMVVFAGVETVEGTGPCRHTVWTFNNGKVQYSVSTLGCTEDKPLQNANGQLSVYINGEHKKSWWCVQQ